MRFNDHFSSHAAGYAKSRPTYPAALFAELAAMAPDRALAWDAGSGNGQAAVALADHFARVVASEPSAEQLAQQIIHPKVTYVQAAETLAALADGSVDLITVAQAVHWFDRPTFFAEVRRVARPNAVVAVWTYTLCHIAAEVDAVVSRFYEQTIGAYWPPETLHCINGYRDLDFPFDEMPFPKLAMELVWSLDEYVDYIATWSAVARYKHATGHDPMPPLRAELAGPWGEAATRRRILWPLPGRLGRVV